MIDPTFATVIIVVFLLIFGVGLPLLNVKFSDFVSYRWCVIVVILALLIGAVIDFDMLSDEARYVVLLGGLIIVGVYVALRTIEKVLAKGWLKGARIEASKGDISVKVTSDRDDSENDS